MTTPTTPYQLSTRTRLPYEQAVQRVTDELKKEGFGVLTEIDVKATLKAKLDVDFRPYIILGACNPPTAFKSLSHDIDMGLLLPCNVIIYDDGGVAVVAAIDPAFIFSVVESPELDALASDMQARLKRVLAAVGA